jgi:hypothetical protein
VAPDTLADLGPGHVAPVTVLERFSCAPGPAGWRYAASRHEPGGAARGRVDVTVDGRWRQARVEVRTDGWSLRGGVAGAEVLWVRAGLTGAAEPVEHAERALGFAGVSPGLLVATARTLALAPGGTVSVMLVSLSVPTLAARTVRQRWTLLDVAEYAAGEGSLPVERYQVADLDTGVVAEVHVAGDVVLDAPGVELRALEGPPNLAPVSPG